MNDDREEAWARLGAMAQRLLEHPKELAPRDPIRLYGSMLRLWHFPSFGPQTTWTILTPGKKAPAGSLPMVREVVWDSHADETGPLGETPAMRVRDASLPPAELERWIDVGKQLAVPLLVFGHENGLEGEYHGIETYELSPFVKAQWWNEGPAEWRHLIDWVTALRAWLLKNLEHA